VLDLRKSVDKCEVVGEKHAVGHIDRLPDKAGRKRILLKLIDTANNYS